MEIIKEKLHNVFNFIITNILCSILQVAILVCLGIIQMLTWFICTQINYFSFRVFGFYYNIPLLISYSVIIIIYGIVWFIFWSCLYKEGIKWFYYRVIFSIIPLIVVLLKFNPAQDPMAMISFKQEPIFSSLVTGVILLPIYSVLIYKFILQSKINKKRNSFFVCLGMLVLGSLIFVSSWNTMNIIYK